MHTLLKQSGMTRKRTKRQRQSKNSTPESKAEFKAKLNAILDDGGDVLFQDESHFSHNVLPLYGYSPSGQPCCITEAVTRKAHTLIMAFSRSGQVFWKVYEGSINAARMKVFVDELPPIRVLMDNHIVHKTVRMDVEKIFTPVAQPYANPIEIVFSKLKLLYRSINADHPEMSVEAKIDRAIESLNTADLEGAVEHVRGFANARY